MEVIKGIVIWLTLVMIFFAIFEYLKYKKGMKNIFSQEIEGILGTPAVLFVLQEVIHSDRILIVFLLFILDMFFAGMCFLILSTSLKIDPKKIVGFNNSQIMMVSSFIIILFTFCISFVVVKNEGNAYANHKISKFRISKTKKNEGDYKSYEVNVISASETPSHKYLKIMGTTNAPDGSKIFTNDDEDSDSSSTSSFNDTNENGWSRVNDGKFATYVSLYDVIDDLSYKVGGKVVLQIFAVSGLNHDSDYEISAYKLDKLLKNSTKYNYYITQGVHDALYVKDMDSSSSSDDDASNVDETTYTEDLKDEVSSEISNDNVTEDVKDISVSGQFDFKPMSMAITIKSVNFTGYPDDDYYYVLDAIKACEKYNPEGFDNIKIILSGKLTGGEFVPIQSYDISGKDIKELKTDKINVDNLSLDNLEHIASDHFYRQGNN